MTLINKQHFLKDINLFKGVTSDKLAEYEKFIEIRKFNKGDGLFAEGDKPVSLWLVLEGELKVYKEYASGKSATIGIFGEGGMIAEVAVIDGKPYPASCKAATDGKVAVIKSHDALNIITSNPDIAYKIMGGLSKKLREITSDLGSMSVQSVIRRLSRFLLKMAERFGEEKKGETSIELFLTRKDLAECIGTSFEVAVRCLKKLEKEGVLKVDGKNILIKDKKTLIKFSDE